MDVAFSDVGRLMVGTLFAYGEAEFVIIAMATGRYATILGRGYCRLSDFQGE
jgi:hypothetical protein